MSDAPELRPARPVRRRRDAEADTRSGADDDGRLDRLEAVVAEGFAGLERHLQGSRAGADRLEEVVELLESAIDHLVGIEQRLDALEARVATPAAKRPPAKKQAASAPRARRGKDQGADTGA